MTSGEKSERSTRMPSNFAFEGLKDDRRRSRESSTMRLAKAAFRQIPAMRRVRDFLRAKPHAPILKQPARNATFEDFLRKLLAVESGINPANFMTYVRDYELPAVSYPRVCAPGRVVRDRASGSPVVDRMTVATYFETLGVGALFDPTSPACISAMQYAATNALGFVGYQFGESALINLGYYRPEVVRTRDERGQERDCDSYYLGSVPDEIWRDGRTEIIRRMGEADRLVLATDVNRWRGTFTGKNGIFSLDDLKQPELQDRVIRDNLDANQAILANIFGRYRPGARSAHCTWSALLAAAHLCGPYAAATFILNGTSATDEFQTDLRAYVQAFADFETPYDANLGSA